MQKAGRAIGKTYGQEKNNTIYNLARMNMLQHGVKDTEFEIVQGVDPVLFHRHSGLAGWRWQRSRRTTSI